jgi:fructose-1,6-bisphosphatase II
VVDRDAAQALVQECMDAPTAWTLALIARVKGKPVRDLSVVVLARARHEELIEEIRATGARIVLLEDGDVVGALLAAIVGTGVDVLLGIGGASQGVLTACGVKALGGAMLAKLTPQSADERREVERAGLNLRQVYTCDELVRTERIFFAATGITDSQLLDGIKFHGHFADVHSLLIRSETGTRRFIHAEYALSRLPEFAYAREPADGARRQP